MGEKKIQHYDCFFDKKPSKLYLKPFDLESAKQGKPVCTREGKRARIICFDAKGDQPIIALVAMDNETEFIETYHINGRFNDDDKTESWGDLMMLTEEKEGWINVYKTNAGNIFLSKNPFRTREEAFDRRTKYQYIDTIKITWEE